MNPNKIKSLIKKMDKDVEVKIDTPTSFRIFLYDDKSSLPITLLISKVKTLSIKKISDYKQHLDNYPTRVIRVDAFRIMKKYKKRKIKAKKQT